MSVITFVCVSICSQFVHICEKYTSTPFFFVLKVCTASLDREDGGEVNGAKYPLFVITKLFCTFFSALVFICHRHSLHVLWLGTSQNTYFGDIVCKQCFLSTSRVPLPLKKSKLFYCSILKWWWWWWQKFSDGGLVVLLWSWCGALLTIGVVRYSQRHQNGSRFWDNGGKSDFYSCTPFFTLFHTLYTFTPYTPFNIKGMYTLSPPVDSNAAPPPPLPS